MIYIAHLEKTCLTMIVLVNKNKFRKAIVFLFHCFIQILADIVGDIGTHIQWYNPSPLSFTRI